jgi:hypothetical protein
MRRRDYKTEYAARKARGLALGRSLSQTRGHARLGEAPLRPGKSVDHLPDKETKALRAFRASGNATAAAKSAGISPERFRRFLRAEGVAERHGREWAMTDNLVRETEMISEGAWRRVRVRGFDDASAIAQHKTAVRDFLRTRDPNLLAAFAGQAVTDTAGRTHPFEINPNTLLRLMTTGGETFEAVYRIVV